MAGKTSLQALLTDEQEREERKASTSVFLKIERPSTETAFLPLRILPPYDDSGLPYYELKLQYFELPDGLKVTTSPKGDPAERLYWKNNSRFYGKGGVLERTWMKLAPTTKYFWNVVDRNTGEVKILSTTKKAWGMILDEIRKYLADGLDITDPDAGCDISLTISQATNFGKPGVRITGVSVMAHKPSEIGVEDWEDKLHNLKEVTKPQYEMTCEEIEELIPELLGDHYEDITGKTAREPGED